MWLNEVKYKLSDMTSFCHFLSLWSRNVSCGLCVWFVVCVVQFFFCEVLFNDSSFIEIDLDPFS